MANAAKPKVAFIGFGEAGQAFAEGIRATGDVEVAAWDILFLSPEGRPLVEAGERLGVRLAGSSGEAVEGADLVFAAVTAASSLEAATGARAHLKPSQFYLDVNSVSPGRKKETASLVGKAVRYIDLAIMAPVHPKLHRTPVSIAGRHAGEVLPLLRALDMDVTVMGEAIGAAAAVKMVRSVMIKGIEALMYESMLAARIAGVEEQVIGSFYDTYPTVDWRAVADYNLERMASHGLRRAAEMRQSAETLRELGVEPLMAAAIAEHEQAMGDRKLKAHFGGTVPRDRGAILDVLTAQRQAAE